MAVPEQTPYIEHTGNGATTSFSLGFQCESKDHLIVLVDEIEPPIATWSLTGGNVVFTTAPAAGKKIKLQRNTPFGRTTNYQSFNNSFRPQTVNIDFDRIWWKLQELGVADWLMKLYVDRLHQQQEEKINNLKDYVDDRDDELRAYLMEEIRKQGVALDQLDDYYNYLMQRLAQIAVDKGWDASFVVDASGKTQQQINNNIAVKILRASEVGLTKWTYFKKPPYTAQEYTQAYNNGTLLANAIQTANSEGCSGCVVEKGNYPFIYPNVDGITVFQDLLSIGSIHLDGIDSFTVDFSNSTLFVLFDSSNKHQYNISPSTYAAWNLAGALISIHNSRGVTFKNATLRGDQYTRSWVAGEKETEQTYGIKCSQNNRNFRFENIKFTGFRGDGIQGYARGFPITGSSVALRNWSAGGIDLVTGADITLAGAYKSNRIDLRGNDIIDNRVQIMTLAARKIPFRSTYVDAFFYDASGGYLSSYKTEQAVDITLPTNTAFIQFVAYEDERTTPTVTYSSLSYGVQLHTGMSWGFTVDGDCEFYENHRGGISNLGGGLVVEAGARFYDSGLLSKKGFPAYSYTTQYGINLEDTYINDLGIDGVRMDNVPIGVISNTRHLSVTNSKILNTYYGAIAIFGSNRADISGCTIENNGPTANLYGAIAYTGDSNDAAFAQLNIHDNKLLNASLRMQVKDFPNVHVSLKDNEVYRGKFIADGNGKNLVVTGNTIYEFAGAGNVHKGVYVKGAAAAYNNTVIGVPFFTHTGTASSAFDGVFCANNSTEVKGPLNINTTNLPNEAINIIGNTYKTLDSTKHNCRLAANPSSGDFVGTKEQFNLIDNDFVGVKVGLYGASSSATYLSGQLVFKDCNFTGGAFIEHTLRGDTTITTEYLFVDCDFDLTASSYLFYNTYGTTNVVLRFVGCTFRSDTVKSMSFLSGLITNLVATTVDCVFLNVTNTSSALQTQGTTKVTYDPPSLANGVQQSTAVTLTGAKLGDNINVSFDKLLSGTRIWGEVTSADTVTVYHRNDTGAVVDVASGTLTVKLI